MGRNLSGQEMRRMVMVENIITSYRDYKRATDNSKWIKDNPERYKIIREGLEAWQIQK